jgi:hypothetical protein
VFATRGHSPSLQPEVRARDTRTPNAVDHVHGPIRILTRGSKETAGSPARIDPAAKPFGSGGRSKPASSSSAWLEQPVERQLDPEEFDRFLSGTGTLVSAYAGPFLTAAGAPLDIPRFASTPAVAEASDIGVDLGPLPSVQTEGGVLLTRTREARETQSRYLDAVARDQRRPHATPNHWTSQHR